MLQFNLTHKVKNMKSGQFKVTEPVSLELKEAILAHVKDQAEKKKRKLTTLEMIKAMASTADREATINAVKTLINQDMLKISSSRRSSFHTHLTKPFEERLLRLPGPGRGRPKTKKDDVVATENEAE